MNADQDYEILEVFCRDFLRRIHTVKPAVVTAVNSDNTIDAKILTKTRYKDKTQTTFQDVLGVPYLILSGNAGAAKITMPLKVNDNVVVLFSDRDYTNLLDTDGKSPVDAVDVYTHQYHPIIALPCFYTAPNAVPVDTSSVIIQNNGSTIKIDAAGNIELTGNQINLAGTNINLTGLVSVNGVVWNTHRHAPSTSPPSNP